MAKEQYKRACVLFDTSSPMAEVGMKAMGLGKDDGDDEGGESLPVGQKGNHEKKDLSESFDNPRRWLVDQCPADKTYQVGEKSFVVRYTDLCEILRIAGIGGVMASLLAAAFIVVRR
ncbi:MAG: virulence factor TspB C-terminal domain-related protein [Rhodocyclaceae bacterium]